MRTPRLSGREGRWWLPAGGSRSSGAHGWASPKLPVTVVGEGSPAAMETMTSEVRSVLTCSCPAGWALPSLQALQNCRTQQLLGSDTRRGCDDEPLEKLQQSGPVWPGLPRGSGSAGTMRRPDVLVGEEVRAAKKPLLRPAPSPGWVRGGTGHLGQERGAWCGSRWQGKQQAEGTLSSLSTDPIKP